MSINALLETQTLVSLGPDASIAEAVAIMSHKRIGSVVVLRGQTLVGIFTERDLLNKVVAQDLDRHSTTVSHVMTTDVVTITPDVSLEECYNTMKNKNFRHLPVVQDGQVLGIVSIRNLMDLLIQQLSYERDLLKQYVEG
jgi:CBS domain-containing protein